MKRIDRSLKRLICWLAGLCLMAILSSCSSKLENEIAGKWQEINGTENMEFSKEGAMRSVDNGISLSGSFKYIGKDRIKIEMGGPGASAGTIEAKVVISDGVLTFTMKDGKVLKYKKAQ